MSDSVEVLHRCQNCGNGVSGEDVYSLYTEFASDWVRETVEKGEWDALRAEILMGAESFAKRLYRQIKQDHETHSGLWAK